jgi:hypothetical protein
MQCFASQSQPVAINDGLVTDRAAQILIAPLASEVIVVGYRNVQIGAPLQCQCSSCRDRNVHKIVGGARIEECCEPLIVDVNVDLHCAPGSWLDCRGRVNGDHRACNGLCRHRLIVVVEHFYYE